MPPAFVQLGFTHELSESRVEAHAVHGRPSLSLLQLDVFSFQCRQLPGHLIIKTAESGSNPNPYSMKRLKPVSAE